MAAALGRTAPAHRCAPSLVIYSHFHYVAAPAPALLDAGAGPTCPSGAMRASMPTASAWPASRATTAAAWSTSSAWRCRPRPRQPGALRHRPLLPQPGARALHRRLPADDAGVRRAHPRAHRRAGGGDDAGAIGCRRLDHDLVPELGLCINNLVWPAVQHLPDPGEGTATRACCSPAWTTSCR